MRFTDALDDRFARLTVMPSQKPPRDRTNDVEYQFTSFVREFGGEVVADLLPHDKAFPLNADYLLFGREVVAELKCLEKDYFRNVEVGEKLARLANDWARTGLLSHEQIATGRFSTDALPEKCGLQAISVFAKPLREAVTHANDQLKATKAHFQIPG